MGSIECSFGIVGKDYVILASDMSAGRGVIKMKSDENKIKALGPHLAMAFSGEPGDTNNYTDFVDRNLRLYQMRNNHALLPASASAWIRRSLAESIRSRSPYAVNLLLGGYDITTDVPHLYWIDYLGTKATLQYGAHGFGMYVALSLMDKWWFEGMGKEDGLKLLQKCINEVSTRMVVKFDFNCILIDKAGIHRVDLDNADPLADVKAAEKKAQQDAEAAMAAAPTETPVPAVTA